MSDEQPLVALLWPLARGRNVRKAQAWGLRLVGPERIERLAHGDDDEAYVAHAAAAGAVCSGIARPT